MNQPGKGVGPAKPKDEGMGFESKGVGEVKDSVGAVAAIAREEAELKAAIVVAKRFPRSEEACYQKLMKSCERASFSDGAFYDFPRGREDVQGPSIKMAREAVRIWGNVRYGLRVVSDDEESLHIKGWTLDLETNTYSEEEDKFAKLIFRKKGGWIKPDERDLRELKNRRGAVCVRNCILHVLPPDLIDDAFRKVMDTARKAARGELKQDRKAAIRRMVKALEKWAVSVEMIEKLLGHPMEDITDDEVVKLQGIMKSLDDGNSKREEHFTVAEAKGPAGPVDLTEALATAGAGKETPAKTTETKPPTKPAESGEMTDEEKAKILADEKKEAEEGGNSSSLFPKS